MDDVDIGSLAGVEDDLIAGFELIEVAEDFAEDIVVGAEDKVAGLAGVGGANVLANAFFELIPAVALHNRRIYANGRDLDAHGMFWAGGGDGQVGHRLDERAQVGRDFVIVGAGDAVFIGRWGVAGGQDNGLHQGGGRQRWLNEGGADFSVGFADGVEEDQCQRNQAEGGRGFDEGQQCIQPGAALLWSGEWGRQRLFFCGKGRAEARGDGLRLKPNDAPRAAEGLEARLPVGMVLFYQQPAKLIQG